MEGIYEEALWVKLQAQLQVWIFQKYIQDYHPFESFLLFLCDANVYMSHNAL